MTIPSKPEDLTISWHSLSPEEVLAKLNTPLDSECHDMVKSSG